MGFLPRKAPLIMSLSNGRSYLAIPGPSVLPDRVLNAMHRASPNIYEGDLHALAASLWPDLRKIAGTAHDVAAYICNGHGVWEAANSNLFSRGDRALVLASGPFGIGWAAAARALGIEVDLIEMSRSAAPDFGALIAALRADKAGRIKAVLATHVDTATSVRTDIAGLRAAIDSTGHGALLAVDCIASLGSDAYHMDDWGVDVTVAASQKGLMTPPGMGFVWFSPKARERSARSDLRTPYWDWQARADATEFSQLWNGTAPTQHLFGLREALNMILNEEGLAHVWARHEALAGAVWAAFDAWGAGNDKIALNVADPIGRGRSVTAARLGAPDGTRLRTYCETQGGVTLGIGLGMAEPGDPAYHGFLRVAHMGHVNSHMTLGALAVMDAGLKALGIAHGRGALDAAAEVVARATRADAKP
jgi:alanine-glyoxylate transaminase/serine-glyoxylate transaminase/serine-pyruvate transaminase